MKKRLAVVAGGWHFPLHFYKAMSRQIVPEGWEVDLFCVSHRDPKYSAEEKKDIIANLGWSYREALDRILYHEFATIEKIQELGWGYKEYPNTIGDWGMTNQWLEEHDYKTYDVILATHDDNLILTDRLYVDLLVPEGEWIVTTNGVDGPPLSRRERIKQFFTRPIPMRGSFEFMKRELLDTLGGKFDLSEVTLTREGQVYSSADANTIRDWNNHVKPFKRLLTSNHLKNKVRILSPYVRVSEYCVEGHRGYISSSQTGHRDAENKGFAMLQKKYDALISKEWRGEAH